MARPANAYIHRLKQPNRPSDPKSGLPTHHTTAAVSNTRGSQIARKMARPGTAPPTSTAAALLKRPRFEAHHHQAAYILHRSSQHTQRAERQPTAPPTSNTHGSKHPHITMRTHQTAHIHGHGLPKRPKHPTSRRTHTPRQPRHQYPLPAAAEVPIYWPAQQPNCLHPPPQPTEAPNKPNERRANLPHQERRQSGGSLTTIARPISEHGLPSG